MDHPTARRRRHAGSANSVTVAQLQAKSTPSELASASAIKAQSEADAWARDEEARRSHGREAQAHDRETQEGPPDARVWPVDTKGLILQPQGPPPDAPGGLFQPQGRPLDGHTMTAPMPAIGLPELTQTLNLPAVIPDPDDEPPARPEDIADEPRTSTRLARTIVAMLVTIVACGVVTGFAARGDEPAHRLSPDVPVVQPAIMSGPAVVRLDRILAELGSRAPTTSPLPRPPASTQSQAPLVNHSAASKVVTDFYSALPKGTEDAFDLLAIGMQGDGLATFKAGWEDVREVVPTILPPQDDAVWVRVSVEEKVLRDQNLNGELYQLTMRIEVRTVRVEGAPQQRIVGAQLLSAHRS